MWETAIDTLSASFFAYQGSVDTRSISPEANGAPGPQLGQTSPQEDS